MKKIRKAVFPVAGFGTRFLPATKAMPKELLPIVDKPLIQYAVEEAIAAGIDTLIFVTGRNKRAIEDHFDNNQELEMALRAKGKFEQADMVKNILPKGVECIFVRQAEQLGLGHAVLCAERVVGGDPSGRGGLCTAWRYPHCAGDSARRLGGSVDGPRPFGTKRGDAG